MHIYREKPPSSLLEKEVSFMELYRATARQRGNSFPSCAWRISQLHRDFSLAFALDFLDLTTFLRQILGKYIRLIFLPHFTTTAYCLYHSKYGFWQVHFRHLILHMRLLCNMIVDIHCDLCIRMTHHILHNFRIDIVLTQSGTSRMTKGMR